MKHLLLLPLLALTLHTQAQRVTNVTAEQLGQELLIHYHLEADGPVEVLLYLSTDRGSRWEGPLKSCSGDVGPNVAPGTGKRIRWEVLKDRELVGDGIAFKVVAKGGVKKEWLNPALTYGSVKDIDGNTYATIQIGEQVWMAENLRTTRYQNGDRIPNATDAGSWRSLNSGAWCHFNNDPNYEVPYGKLYNWYTVRDPRNVCPAGWHVPTDREWNILVGYLDPLYDQRAEYQSAIAGARMKSTIMESDTILGITNRIGFSGLSGGNRDERGDFSKGFFTGSGVFPAGYWWSASKSSSGNSVHMDSWGKDFGWYRSLTNDKAGIYRYMARKGVGFSVRCLRD
jgi:uncharacterized protein (TIGR02145 family)